MFKLKIRFFLQIKVNKLDICVVKDLLSHFFFILPHLFTFDHVLFIKCTKRSWQL